MLPRLEARPEPSNAMRYASPLLAVVLTLVGGLVIFAALGKNPVEGFRVFFLSPLKDAYGVSELLLKATPLMLIAVGPRGRLPRQRLEHRRRGPVHPRRDRRRRRRALLRRAARARCCCR